MTRRTYVATALASRWRHSGSVGLSLGLGLGRTCRVRGGKPNPTGMRRAAGAPPAASSLYSARTLALTQQSPLPNAFWRDR